MTNPGGVSDYLTIQVSHYLIVFNPADVALALGLIVMLGSVAANVLVRISVRIGVTSDPNHQPNADPALGPSRRLP